MASHTEPLGTHRVEVGAPAAVFEIFCSSFSDSREQLLTTLLLQRLALRAAREQERAGREQLPLGRRASVYGVAVTV